jgi:hypothetical protein
MAHFIKNNEAVARKAPDNLVFAGNLKLENSVILIIDYGAESVEESSSGNTQPDNPLQT